MDQTDPERELEQRRNRNFDETHRLLIETAVELISKKGAEALSVSALARAAGINRSTVYYHFEGREAMLAAVRQWSSEQLARGFNPDVSVKERNDQITRFVLLHPEVVKLWIDDFISPGDIRERYPHWDELVNGLAESMRAAWPDEHIDAEVFSVILLTGAFIGPRVFMNSVRPEETVDQVVMRFTRESQRMLQHEGLRLAWSGGEE